MSIMLSPLTLTLPFLYNGIHWMILCLETFASIGYQSQEVIYLLFITEVILNWIALSLLTQAVQQVLPK
jgi:hypothetical protein